jgi:septal ring factor EnvC (AmiA/AmiB activator)
VQRPRITSAQLREIGTMLQRLTRENAALIQARDAAQGALEPLTEELRAARATLAAAEAGAGAAARQVAAQEAAAAETGAELARLRIGQRKAVTDKERLTAEVSVRGRVWWPWQGAIIGDLQQIVTLHRVFAVWFKSCRHQVCVPDL